MTYILGILYNREKNEDEEVLLLLEKRTEARRNKDYKLADELRDEITARGYSIEDTANGPKLVKN
jgi:cysteinyl-tRNA synthetase